MRLVYIYIASIHFDLQQSFGTSIELLTTVTMKVAIILACISVVFCAPDKRVFLGSLTSFDTTHLKQTVQTLLNVVGTDATEGLCETECHTLLTDPSHFLHYSCPLVCHGLQSLAQSFHLVPATQTQTTSP